MNQLFGENKNGVWIPKAPSVSDFGNHGFRLQYKNTSVGSGSSSVIGVDTSGKDNHFTSSGTATHDCAMIVQKIIGVVYLEKINKVHQQYLRWTQKAVLTGGNSARTSV